MKLVGEAFKNDRYYNGTDQKIVVLGIASWVIKDRMSHHLDIVDINWIFGVCFSFKTVITNSKCLLNENVIVDIFVLSWIFFIRLKKCSEIFFKRKNNFQTIYEYKKAKKGFSHLDSNHSHLLLVDNAKVEFGGEVDFRAQLEAKLSQNNQDDSSMHIPLVVLVLGGGINTIKSIKEAVTAGTPCVIFNVGFLLGIVSLMICCFF